MSVTRTTSSGACGRPSGRPTSIVPMVVPRDRSGTASPSVGVAMRTGAASALAAVEQGAQLRGRPRPGVGVQRRAQLGELVLVGVGERGEPQRARVGQVHGAPAPQPRHHDLRDDGDGQLHRQRLAQQLAGLGEVGHPGAAALVDGAQPARLHGHGDAVGDQLHEVLAAVAVARRAEQPDRAAQRRRDGQRDVEHDRPARGSGAGELGGPPAVALVDDHGHGVHVEHVPQAPHELLDQLQGLEPVARGPRARAAAAGPARG